MVKDDRQSIRPEVLLGGSVIMHILISANASFFCSPFSLLLTKVSYHIHTSLPTHEITLSFTANQRSADRSTPAGNASQNAPLTPHQIARRKCDFEINSFNTLPQIKRRKAMFSAQDPPGLSNQEVTQYNNAYVRLVGGLTMPDGSSQASTKGNKAETLSIHS